MCVFIGITSFSFSCMFREKGLPGFSNTWTLQGALQVIVTFWESWNSSGSCQHIFSHLSVIGELGHVSGILFFQ